MHDTVTCHRRRCPGTARAFILMRGMSISLSSVSQLILSFRLSMLAFFSDLGASKVSQYASMIRKDETQSKAVLFLQKP